jgi:hypothetical protein
MVLELFTMGLFSYADCELQHSVSHRWRNLSVI